MKQHFDEAKRAITSRKTLDFFIGLAVDDDAPRTHPPAMTYALLIACTVTFLFTKSNIEYYAGNWGFSEYIKFDHYGFNLITPIFFHTGWLDLFGNMAYLLVFGERVERALGTINFSILLICSNIIAECGHLLAVPNHLSVGASGAIAGLLMFYCLTFRKAKIIYQVNYLVRIFFKKMKLSVIEFPAPIFLVIFLTFQLFGAYVQSIGFSNIDSWSHLGGLIGGYVFWYIWRI